MTPERLDYLKECLERNVRLVKSESIDLIQALEEAQTRLGAWAKAHREIQYALDAGKELNKYNPDGDELSKGLRYALEVIDTHTKDVQITTNPLRGENVKDPQ